MTNLQSNRPAVFISEEQLFANCEFYGVNFDDAYDALAEYNDHAIIGRFA